MRKSLKRLKELDNLLEQEAHEEQKEKKKTRKRRKIVERQPNILGGGFVVVSLILLFFAIQYFPDKSGASEGASTIQSHKKLQEKAKAKARVSSELEGYADDIQEKISNFSVLGSTIESKQVEKLEHDVAALQDVPKKAVDGAKHELLTTTLGEVVDSVLRLRKIGEDLGSLKNTTLEKLKEL